MAKMRTISEIRDRGGQFSPTSCPGVETITESVDESKNDLRQEEQSTRYSCPLYPDMDTESNPDPELIDDHDNEIEDGTVTVISGTTTTVPCVQMGPSLSRNEPLGVKNSTNVSDETKENLPPKIGGLSGQYSRPSGQQLQEPFTVGPSGIMPQVDPTVAADMVKYVIDPSFNYVDFARRISGGGGSRSNYVRRLQQSQSAGHDGQEEEHYSTLRVQDYSWDDQGYSLVNQLYTDVGSLLDEKFKTAYNMTYFT